MKRLLCVFLCVALLCGQSVAAPTDDLEGQVMGAYEPPLEDPEWVYTISGMSLEDCRFMSILQGDSEASRKMRENLGDLRQYKLLINEAFGHLPENTLPEGYLNGNEYNARFLMNCLKEIALHPEQFADMMQNFNLIQSDKGVAAGKTTASLVHVYGRENMVCCDVGEISGSQKFLLAAFVSESAGGDSVLTALRDMLCNHVGEKGASAGGQTQTARSRSETDFVLSSGKNESRQEALSWILIAVGIFAVVGGTVAFAVGMIRRKNEPDE